MAPGVKSVKFEDGCFEEVLLKLETKTPDIKQQTLQR